jgi:hypothetical protein
MLLRIGVMLVITGLAFIGMTWLEPVGPLLIILGAACAAVTLEARLDIQDWQRAAAEVPVEAEQPRAA